MEEGTLTRVISNFTTDMEGEISVKRGDIVQILKRIDKHWCYACSNGKFGNVPCDYLVPLDNPELLENEEAFIAVLDFLGQQPNDLSFRKGDLIIGLNQVNEDWWNGKIGSKIGIFPKTYTWQLQSNYFKVNSKSKPVNKKAFVKMNLKAQLEEEMDLHEGEIITVTEIIDETWYRGVSKNRSGIFPAAYVRIIDDDSADTTTFRDSNDGFVQSSLDSESTFMQNNQVLLPESGTSSNNDYSCLEYDLEDNNSSVSDQIFSRSSHCDTKSIFDDEYFKINMPSLYKSLSVSETGSTAFNNSDLDIKPYAITLYPFLSQYDNELSFHENEVVTLLKHVGKDWIEGMIDGKKGIFPLNYVKIIVDCHEYVDHSYDENFHRPFVKELAEGTYAQVLYSFDAQMDGDLTVRKGEKVLIVELIGCEWCCVENNLGLRGLCPQTYLYQCDTRDTTDKNITVSSFMEINDSDFNKSHINSFHQDFIVDKKREDNGGKLATTDTINVDSLILRNLESLACTKTLDPHNKNNDVNVFYVDEANERNKRELHLQKDESNAYPYKTSKFKEETTLHEENKNILKNSNSFPQKHQSWKGFDSVVPNNEDISDNVVLRKHTNRSLSQECNRPVRTDSFYRKPHRPAPPAPVAGQKPIRHLLVQTQSKSTEKSVEETLTVNKDEECAILPSVLNDERQKNLDKRQNIISELVLTEKEYVNGLKITYETFNLHNPSILENRGIDVKTIFGNILEVIHVSEDFLDMLQLAMKGKEDEDQCIGPCFLKFADRMRAVYGEYCMNHEKALSLLGKYEADSNITSVFVKGIETLRYQIVCFDMSSILIKPVQRILKYPLILNELIKCTEDNHIDKEELLKAAEAMINVASYINEHKRTNEIVTKYLEIDDSASSRMSRLSLHSVAKKSSRFGVMLSSTLGITSVTRDPKFDELEAIFCAVGKSIRIFIKNIEVFLSSMHEVLSAQFGIGEAIRCLYQEKNEAVDKFLFVQKKICTNFWNDFKISMNEKVLGPLNYILQLFEGPEKLIQKRNDKLLDYNGCFVKSEKNKDNRQIQEELAMAKSNYEALNKHLLGELPILTGLACELFIECVSAFISARKLFCGKTTKQYFTLIDLPLFETSQSEDLETFAVKYHLILNQLGRLNFITSFKGQKIETPGKRFSLSPVPKEKSQETEAIKKPVQSSSQRAYLQSCYPAGSLYEVITSYTEVQPLDLNVTVGQLVGVIKKKNPMNNVNVWFVDDGVNKGFVPCSCLRQWNRNLETYPTNDTPTSEDKSLLSSCSQSSYSSPDIVRKSPQNIQKPGILLTEKPPSYEAVLLSDSLSDHTATNEETNLRNKATLPSHHYYEEIPDEEFFYALYDFNGNESSDLLTVRRGQVVSVLKKTDFQGNPEWWLVEDRFGKKGYVPANFLSKYG